MELVKGIHTLNSNTMNSRLHVDLDSIGYYLHYIDLAE